MNLAQSIKRELDAKRTQAADAWQEFATARKDALDSGVDLANDADAFDALHEKNRTYGTIADEVRTLEDRFAKALDMDGSGAPAPIDDPGKRAAASGIWTPGLRLVQNETYKQLAESGALMRQQGVELPSVEVLNRDELKAHLQGKALIVGDSDTSAGSFVTPDRQGYYPGLLTPIMVRNLVTVGETNSDLVEWVQEDTFTNAAVEVIEATATSSTGYDNAAKPESSLTFKIVQSAVKTIATWIPATKRALADAGQLRTIVDQRLQDGVNLRLDSQMVNGNASGENFRGILNTTGVGAVAKGAGEPAVEAILRAITTVRLAFMEPTSVLLHPNDYVGIRLMKNTNGDYQMGPPNLPGPEQVWGLPIVQSTVIPENTGLVGKFDEAILWVREGVNVSATDSHSDFFTHNLVAILAEGRFAFGVPRPAAFCKVTAI